MLQNNALLTDPKFWISVFSLFVAGCAALISWRSARNAARALAISESQEKRRQPRLGIYLAKGYRRLVQRRQLFGFLVSVSNPTDINNSIALAELQITYLLENNLKAICRIPHNPALGETVGGAETAQANIFSLPARVDAHQTVSGWFLFAVDHDVIRGGTIDAHKIILQDTHGVCADTEPILVRDWAHENPKG
jgi:hypothetical protein